IVVEFSDQFQTGQAQGLFDHYRLRDGQSDETVDLSRIAIDSHTTLAGSAGLDHHTQLSIGSLDIQGGDADEPVRLEELGASLAGTEIDGLMNVGVQYEFGRMLIGEANAGRLVMGLSVSQL